jgi:hypothetical protein
VWIISLNIVIIHTPCLEVSSEHFFSRFVWFNSWFYFIDFFFKWNDPTFTSVDVHKPIRNTMVSVKQTNGTQLLEKFFRKGFIALTHMVTSPTIGWSWDLHHQSRVKPPPSKTAHNICVAKTCLEELNASITISLAYGTKGDEGDVKL